MTFENVIEPADFRYFGRQMLLRATGWRRFILVFAVFICIPLGLHLCVGFDFLTVIVAVTITMYVLIGYQSLLGRRISPRTGGITFETKTINVDSSGVGQSSKRMQSFYAWDAFQSAQVTDKMLILYLEPAFGIPIPRRNLHPETFHELIKMALHFAPQLEKDLADP